MLQRDGGNETIPKNMEVVFYVKEGETLLVDVAQKMWEQLFDGNRTLHPDGQRHYDENRFPPVYRYSGHTPGKYWLSIPDEEKEGWKAGVYYHTGGDVNKEPDVIDMQEDYEVKAKGNDLDLTYMLQRIQQEVRHSGKNGNPSNNKIVVHMLTCRNYYANNFVTNY